MLKTFFSNSVLTSDFQFVAKGLLLQRLLIVVFACLVDLYIYLNNSSLKAFSGFLGLSLLGIAYFVITAIDTFRNRQTSEAKLFLLLIFDALLIIFLVNFSGGTTNPFIYYLLVMVAIASSLFRKSAIWIFTVFTIISYSSLFFFEIENHLHHDMNSFQLHLIGMWVNFIASAGLIALFVSILSNTLRQQQEQLANAREQNLRNEQLVGIGTLAASTVHALRTPLSTLAIFLSDLKSEQSNTKLDKDLKLMLEQIERCKETTDKLASLANTPDHEQRTQKVIDLMQQLQEHYQLTHPDIAIGFTIDETTKNQHIVQHILLTQSLLNLIDNAIQAARSQVCIKFESESGHVKTHILDDGEGLSEKIVKGWGQPFLSNKKEGLGIGSFLANSTIERFGGKIELLQSPEKNFNTHILVSLPII